MQALHFIVTTFFELYIMAFLLRFLLQWGRADFHNPLSQFIVQITNPLARPVRRVVPGWRGLDFSTLVIAYLLTVTMIAIGLLILVGAVRNVPALFVAGLFELVIMFLKMFLFLIIGQVLLSWFAPHHPIANVLRSLTSPVMRPIQRVLPPIAGLDLSPLFALVAIQALLIFISGLR